MDKSIVPVNHQIAVRSTTCYEFSNSNPAEVVEIEDEDVSVETVEKQLEDLKLDHQFNEKDVPEIFQTLINDRIEGLRNIRLGFNESCCSLIFSKIQVLYEKNTHGWTVTYNKENTNVEMVEIVSPEKSIIDHLWFVYRNPNIKLENFVLVARMNGEAEKKINPEKLTKLLLSMFDSIDHHTQIYSIGCEGFNENVFLSMLKHVKPGKTEEIFFNISWKTEGNYQKMNEIAETDQWKQARSIYSSGVTPLKINDLFHCKKFWLELDRITPEDVLRVTEHALSSTCSRWCGLGSKNKTFDINAIMDVLRSRISGSKFTEKYPSGTDKFSYRVLEYEKSLHLDGDDNHIVVQSYTY